jgi:hypothetical protein
VLLPTVVIQCSGSGAECAGELRRRETRERSMHAMVVVVIPECLQLSRQIGRVPEEDAVQVLAPDRCRVVRITTICRRPRRRDRVFAKRSRVSQIANQ